MKGPKACRFMVPLRAPSRPAAWHEPCQERRVQAAGTREAAPASANSEAPDGIRFLPRKRGAPDPLRRLASVPGAGAKAAFHESGRASGVGRRGLAFS